MSALVNLYDSYSLTEAVNLLPVPEPFVIKNVFKTVVPHDSDAILYEEYAGSEGVAQFVGRNEPNPKSVSKGTRVAKSFQLPRTYESKLFTAQELATINAVGQIFSDVNIRLEEQNKYVARELEQLKSRVIRRREQMACEALATGKIVVTQDNLEMTYDFGFEANKQLVTLSSTKLWTAEGSNPIENIREWRRLIAKRSGVNVRNILLGAAAAEAFLKNANVLKVLDTNNFKVGAVDVNADVTGSVGYLGRISGIDVWEYSQQYVKNGEAIDMIPTERAIVVGESNNFRLHYGPAFRINNGVAAPIISEYLLEAEKIGENKAVQWNLEQKSLPVIHDKGCVISAKVV